MFSLQWQPGLQANSRPPLPERLKHSGLSAMQDAAASAAAARVAELQAQLDEEQAGAAEQRAILRQLRWHLRASAGTGMQEGADQQTLATEVIALVRQQQEESQQQLAAQSAAAAEQAAQFETALKQHEQQQKQAIAKLEAQLGKEKAEQQAAAASAAEPDVRPEKEAEHQAVVAALKESLSHYKAAAQLAHERVSWTTACVHLHLWAPWSRC